MIHPPPEVKVYQGSTCTIPAYLRGPRLDWPHTECMARTLSHKHSLYRWWKPGARDRALPSLRWGLGGRRWRGVVERGVMGCSGSTGTNTQPPQSSRGSLFLCQHKDTSHDASWQRKSECLSVRGWVQEHLEQQAFRWQPAVWSPCLCPLYLTSTSAWLSSKHFPLMKGIHRLSSVLAEYPFEIFFSFVFCFVLIYLKKLKDWL